MNLLAVAVAMLASILASFELAKAALLGLLSVMHLNDDRNQNVG